MLEGEWVSASPLSKHVFCLRLLMAFVIALTAEIRSRRIQDVGEPIQHDAIQQHERSDMGVIGGRFGGRNDRMVARSPSATTKFLRLTWC